MQPIFFRETVTNIEQKTIEEYQIPELLLMENAAQKSFWQIQRILTDKTSALETHTTRKDFFSPSLAAESMAGKSILVCCGKGNNGGDGAALARLCLDAGCKVTLLLVSPVEKNKENARLNLSIIEKLCQESNQSYFFSLERDSLQSTGDEMNNRLSRIQNERWDLIVDAIYGIGFRGNAIKSATVNSVIQMIRKIKNDSSKTQIVSLDLPSGLDCDNPHLIGSSIKADFTICFGCLKPANVLSPAKRYNGQCIVVNVGYPRPVLAEQRATLWTIDQELARKYLYQSNPGAHSSKRERGTVGLIVGSLSYPGAAILAGNSCYAGGVGMVHVAVPQEIAHLVANRALVEIIIHQLGDVHQDPKRFSESSYRIFGRSDLVVIGCGLGVARGLENWLVDFLSYYEGVVLLDADALNLLAPFNRNWQRKFPLILTPHIHEFERLVGKKIDANNRVSEAIAFAQKNEIILLLKGETSLVVHPDGRIAILPFSVESVGRAGSGDVLCGLIASLLGQVIGGQGKFLRDKDKWGFMETIWQATAAALYIAAVVAKQATGQFGNRNVCPDDLRHYYFHTTKQIMKI